MKNTIEIKSNSVIKTFGLRMNYVREVQIYEKLRGSGLAPEMTSNWDGAIEHTFVEGADFQKVIEDAFNNPLEYVECCKAFCRWYKSFREHINMSLGDMRFNDFIYNKGRLYGIDFEGCKPGSLEDDIAMFAGQIVLMSGSYSLLGVENAKIFIKLALESLQMSSLRLYESIMKALETVCAEKNVPVSKDINEYLATFVCSSFVHVPEDGIRVSAISDVLRHTEQMWTVFAKDVTGASEKILMLLMTAAKEDYDVLYLTKGEKYVPYPIMFRTAGAGLGMQLLKLSDLEVEEIVKNKLKSKALPLENLGSITHD